MTGWRVLGYWSADVGKEQLNLSHSDVMRHFFFFWGVETQRNLLRTRQKWKSNTWNYGKCAVAFCCDADTGNYHPVCEAARLKRALNSSLNIKYSPVNNNHEWVFACWRHQQHDNGQITNFVSGLHPRLHFCSFVSWNDSFMAFVCHKRCWVGQSYSWRKHTAHDFQDRITLTKKRIENVSIASFSQRKFPFQPNIRFDWDFPLQSNRFLLSNANGKSYKTH